MSDKKGKDGTPPPLLLMPAGGGLTLNPPDQPGLFMPVVQSEPTLLGSDEEGEADSFVGQTPPPSAKTSSLGPSPPAPSNLPSTSGLFGQGGPSSDPFSQVGHKPQPTPSVGSINTVPPHGGAGFGGVSSPLTGLGTSNVAPPVPPPSFTAGNQSFQPSAIPSSSVEPPSAGGGNLYRRQEGLKRPQYAQMPAGTYAGSMPPGGYNQAAFPGQLPNQLPSSPPLTSIMSPMTGPPVAQVPPTVSQTFSQTLPASPMPPKPQFSATSIPPGSSPAQGIYTQVQAHWCFCKMVERKEIWYPFSIMDSLQLEEAFRNGNDTTPVSTDGGRYDVLLYNRTRRAIYWEEGPTEVRRCTWFYKREGDSRYVPYEEQFAQQLEEEYKNAIYNNTWHKRLEFPGGETIVMHNANVIVHFQPSSQPDEWGMVQGEGMRPRVVKRGVDDFETVEDGEPTQIDHLVFVVHGIGAFCDVKFRNIVECVDDFRSISLSLLKSHFRQHFDSRRIGRVEFLPVHWHSALHGDATGIDSRLKAITLPSTGKLRHFVNDTLMDILFYTSPKYCQTIADTVGSEMNRLYNLFLSRNPRFQGTVSVSGHSLGSSVLFDLLMHQKDPSLPADPAPDLAPDPVEVKKEPVPDSIENSFSTVNDDMEGTEELTLEEILAKVGLQDKFSLFEQEQIDVESLSMCSESDLKDLGLPMGPRKKLKGVLQEEQSKKEKRNKHNEQKQREEEERRIREKIAAEQKEQSPDLNSTEILANRSVSVEFIPGVAGTGQPSVHYPRLDFQPCALFALGSPIGIFLSSRGVDNIGDDFRLPTCPRVYNIFHPAYRLEPLVIPHASSIKPFLIPHYKGRKRLHLELKESLTRVGADIKQKIMESLRSTWNSINQFAKAHRSDAAEISLEEQVDSQMSSVMHDLEDDQSSVASSHGEDIHMGLLNEGRRIDYVLQERPIESFNDYLFALSSHGCYWESEDTVLLVLKELYSPFGISPQMPGPDTSPQKLYNTAGPSPQGPLRGVGVPPMPQFSPPESSLGKQSSIPLIAPSQSQSQNFGPPPPSMGGIGSMQPPQNYGSTLGGAPGSGPPQRPAGPPPLTGFVKGMQK
ncbi:hypothetical protein FSP39_006892 [Pinctada imbricata]|uniref:SEC23-interacting protein n=1 Tax=Pinctada imbricata TaxID=66713 RepID=A0AA89BRF1_PINIB|nr:hypothetical protein FSP39_006892 [Pinctada imbricata]